jgi:hypothetical protein
VQNGLAVAELVGELTEIPMFEVDCLLNGLSIFFFLKKNKKNR